MCNCKATLDFPDYELIKALIFWQICCQIYSLHLATYDTVCVRGTDLVVDNCKNESCFFQVETLRNLLNFAVLYARACVFVCVFLLPFRYPVRHT